MASEKKPVPPQKPFVPASAEAEAARQVLAELEGPLAAGVSELVRCLGFLPVGEDHHFFSNFPEFKENAEKIRQRSASLLRRFAPPSTPWPAAAAAAGAEEDAMEWLVNVQDDRLELVDTALDAFYKKRKAEAGGRHGRELVPIELNEREGAPRGSWKSKFGRGRGPAAAIPFHVASLARPQETFCPPIDNSNHPFQHPEKLSFELPQPWLPGVAMDSDAPSAVEGNAVESNDKGSKRGEGLGNKFQVLEEHARRLGVLAPAGSPSRSHPLQAQLLHLQYPDWQLEIEGSIRSPLPLEKTPFTFIETLPELQAMAAKLQAVQEFAVDLEHHSYRSFQGFVCLMQISTRDEDFVVDTLALRSHVGPTLGPLFADHRKLKVMHGADRDILWLQCDFGIYVANLFDTGQASRVLQMGSHSLAFLLHHFCQVAADKRYQLADWRIRPFPPEMLKYAREDTHYLLFIYDQLRVRLLREGEEKETGNSLVLEVLHRSRNICLQLYEKDIFTETSYLKLYMSLGRSLAPHQQAVLAGLYAWRDRMAREEDESTAYVMPNHLLLRLAEDMPSDVRSLHSVLRGSAPLVGKNAAAVVEIICEAKDKAVLPKQLLERPPAAETTRKVDERQETKELNKEISVVERKGKDDGGSSTGDVAEQKIGDGGREGDEGEREMGMAVPQRVKNDVGKGEQKAANNHRKQVQVVAKKSSKLAALLGGGRPSVRLGDVGERPELGRGSAESGRAVPVKDFVRLGTGVEEKEEERVESANGGKLTASKPGMIFGSMEESESNGKCGQEGNGSGEGGEVAGPRAEVEVEVGEREDMTREKGRSEKLGGAAAREVEGIMGKEEGEEGEQKVGEREGEGETKDGRRKAVVSLRPAKGGLATFLGNGGLKGKGTEAEARAMAIANQIRSTMSLPFLQHHTTAITGKGKGKEKETNAAELSGSMQKTASSEAATRNGHFHFTTSNIEVSGGEGGQGGDAASGEDVLLLEDVVELGEREGERDVQGEGEGSEKRGKGEGELREDMDIEVGEGGLPLSLSEKARRQRKRDRKKMEEREDGGKRVGRGKALDDDSERNRSLAARNPLNGEPGVEVANNGPVVREGENTDLPAYDFAAARKRLNMGGIDGRSRERIHQDVGGKGTGGERGRGARGRGGRGRGRGGDGREEEEDGLKGGKRSQVFPRSGNRSMTYRK